MRARGLVGLAVIVTTATAFAVATNTNANAAQGSPTPQRSPSPSALTPAQIAALSANQNQRVIVLLANQHPEVPGTVANLGARAKALSADQSAILSELRTVHAPRTHGYSFVNAISATVSHEEALRLASEAGVSAVVPDVQISPAPSAPTAGATGGTSSAKSPKSAKSPQASPNSVPASQAICPSDPADPLLEPEALGLMHVPDAQNIVDGAGVKVAVFPDGLDPNIPDFIRPNGQHAIFDYQDFTGEGPSGVTGGEEAFGDASSIIAQGNQVYDLSGEVNPAHPLPAGCNIRIKGVAPGASLAVMKIFGEHNLAFSSELLQGLEWAVEHDHVDVLSESFGGNPIPNDAQDATTVFDNDAVAAGLTVVVSSGDAGITNTIGAPATSPDVISAGATTSYRLYKQVSYGGAQFGAGGWESNEISSFSSSGTTDFGPHTIDLVAPGEAGWADCSSQVTVFTECADIYNGPNPQPIVAFGGTSQSAPLTAGTAALVIQAYRQTHHGATPSPAQVKQILTSSAQNIDAPSDDQGAGLVNAYRAVLDAKSVHDTNGTPPAGGEGLLVSPTQVGIEASPNALTNTVVNVTNNGSVTQTVSPVLKALGAPSTLAQGTLNLIAATDPTFIQHNGTPAQDEHLITFSVPAGLSDLDSRIAWKTAGNAGSILRATLFDPAGRITSHSRPQGTGGGFGDDLIQDPAPGTWTLLVYSSGTPYTGQLVYTITGQTFQNVQGAVIPASRTIAAGQTMPFVVLTHQPGQPGDVAESLDLTSNVAGDLSTVPFLMRTTVPVSRSAAGSFTGSLTGGNARQAFYGQELQYQFVVPTGAAAVNVNVAVGAPGYQVFGFLVDPNQTATDTESTLTPTGSANTQALHLSWANPLPGTWSVFLAQFNGVSSLRTSTPVTGTIDLNGARLSSSGIPGPGVRLPAGQASTATITVTNNGNSPELFSLDPRLNATETIGLPSQFGPDSNLALPVSDPSTVPQYLVPPFSSRVDVAAQSTVPITLDTSPAFGTPDVEGQSIGNAAIATITGDIPASTYSCGPAELGPFSGPAPSATFSCGADAKTLAFDPAVDSSTGNPWSAFNGITGNYDPLLLNPGQSGTITVAFSPSGHSGQLVKGNLSLETFNFVTDTGGLWATIPYQYHIQ